MNGKLYWMVVVAAVLFAAIAYSPALGQTPNNAEDAVKIDSCLRVTQLINADEGDMTNLRIGDVLDLPLCAGSGEYIITKDNAALVRKGGGWAIMFSILIGREPTEEELADQTVLPDGPEEEVQDVEAAEDVVSNPLTSSSFANLWGLGISPWWLLIPLALLAGFLLRRHLSPAAGPRRERMRQQPLVSPTLDGEEFSAQINESVANAITRADHGRAIVQVDQDGDEYVDVVLDCGGNGMCHAFGRDRSTYRFVPQQEVQGISFWGSGIPGGRRIRRVVKGRAYGLTFSDDRRGGRTSLAFGTEIYRVYLEPVEVIEETPVEVVQTPATEQSMASALQAAEEGIVITTENGVMKVSFPLSQAGNIQTFGTITIHDGRVSVATPIATSPDQQAATSETEHVVTVNEKASAVETEASSEIALAQATAHHVNNVGE